MQPSGLILYDFYNESVQISGKVIYLSLTVCVERKEGLKWIEYGNLFFFFLTNCMRFGSWQILCGNMTESKLSTTDLSYEEGYIPSVEAELHQKASGLYIALK